MPGRSRKIIEDTTKTTVGSNSTTEGQLALDLQTRILKATLQYPTLFQSGELPIRRHLPQIASGLAGVTPNMLVEYLSGLYDLDFSLTPTPAPTVRVEEGNVKRTPVQGEGDLPRTRSRTASTVTPVPRPRGRPPSITKAIKHPPSVAGGSSSDMHSEETVLESAPQSDIASPAKRPRRSSTRRPQ